MSSTNTTEDKRMYIIWISVIGMLAIAILLGLLFPATFSFWMCAGVFLAGIGLIAGLLLLFMGKKYVSFFSAALFIAGILLILGQVLPMFIPGFNALIMVAIAAIVVVIGLILWIVLAKK